jgi:hypothetical protein
MRNEFYEKIEAGRTLSELKKEGIPLSQREENILSHDEKMREEGKSPAGPDDRGVTRGEAQEAMKRTDKEMLPEPRLEYNPAGTAGSSAPKSPQDMHELDQKHSQQVLAERIDKDINKDQDKTK